MEENNKNLYEELICSEDFDNALVQASEIKFEISDNMKTRNKNNYEYFYDIMLRSRTDIQEICDKKKKNRTPEENEALKKFIKKTKKQYRFVKDMMFLSEDEKMNDDGTTNKVPKKVQQIVEKLSAVVSILRYIGQTTLEDELNKNGVSICPTPLECQSEAFENEEIKKSMISVFDESCNIQRDIDFAESKIKDEIFTNLVPSQLQYDKNSNPSGLRDGDFGKLVGIKFKLMKSERADEEAKEKAAEQAINEAEKRTFEIERNKTMRAGLIAMGADPDSENVENAEQ